MIDLDDAQFFAFSGSNHLTGVVSNLEDFLVVIVLNITCDCVSNLPGVTFFVDLLGNEQFSVVQPCGWRERAVSSGIVKVVQPADI